MLGLGAADDQADIFDRIPLVGFGNDVLVEGAVAHLLLFEVVGAGVGGEAD